MRGEWTRRHGTARLGQATTAMLALLSAAALAAGSQAEAAAHRTGPATAAGVISTVAGGVGGPALATTVGLNYPGPCGVSYAAGQLYVADGNSVRAVNTLTDGLTTPAGTALDGPLGIGGLATASSGLGTCGVAADAAGNLVIAVPRPEHILVAAQVTGSFYGQAMTAGHIYNVAGDGKPGFTGDGGPATAARIHLVMGVSVDGAGNLLIPDTSNNRIRVVAVATGTFYGQAMTAGDIYTVAGAGGRGYTGNAGPATSAKLDLPYGVSVDSAGNLLISDTVNNRIRVVAATSGTFYKRAMTAGDIYTIAGNGTNGFAGDGGPATSAELADPTTVAVDGAGNLVIADDNNGRIRVLADKTGTFYGQAMTAGDIYTVAGNGTDEYSGDGGPATSAGLFAPEGAAVDGAGNLVIADKESGRIRVVAAASGTFYGQAMTAGDIYTVAGTGAPGGLFQFSGDGGPAAQADLNAPLGVAADSAGDMQIADSANERVRVVPASNGTFYGQVMKAGDIYTVAGDGTNGFTGDGGPGTSAWVSNPGGVTTDSAGNLLIADGGNNRIRVVADLKGTYYGQAMKAGDIYTIAGDGRGFAGDGGPATAAEFASPHGIALDAAGNLLIPDTFNDRIRVVAESTGTFYGQAMTAGDIYTVAGDGGLGFAGDGGPATAAELCEPYADAADGAGNLLISDGCNNRIRVVAEHSGTFYGQAMTAGDIYTIAGGGSSGLGDGGPATAAELNFTAGIAVDSAGNVLIADGGNNRIRVVAIASGTYYGQAMTAGDIYTVAGKGTGPDGALGAGGFTGDGGPGTKAEVSMPGGVAVDGTGLLIADTLNNRIRLVTG